MRSNEKLPSRVRALVLGGGIHGVGILHDLASRGWKDIHLVEKNQLGSGTSSRSTKLIHGGLRYLKNPFDFDLVKEALSERGLLMQLAPDLVHPIRMMLPAFRNHGMPPQFLKIGLTLYDFLAGKAAFRKHEVISAKEFSHLAPMVRTDNIKKVFSFWDGQTDDLALVTRVAESAAILGGQISENCHAESVKPTDDGWEVLVRTARGEVKKISALYVINALGPWSNIFLNTSGIEPKILGLNNEGVHLLVKDLGFKSGVLFQLPGSKRIFFVLPWQGLTLIGTTEDLFAGSPDALRVREETVKHLLDSVNQFFNVRLHPNEILTTFSGLRWLPVQAKKSLSGLSRSAELGIHKSERGFLLTIYGGKLTTYRSLAKKVGDIVMSDFGEKRESKTDDPNFWKKPDAGKSRKTDVVERFAAIMRSSAAS
ncbi:MAG: glycerol-3-phosphate dehydrogenase/oxidase [Oligoflexales bacterium]